MHVANSRFNGLLYWLIITTNWYFVVLRGEYSVSSSFKSVILLDPYVLNSFLTNSYCTIMHEFSTFSFMAIFPHVKNEAEAVEFQSLFFFPAATVKNKKIPAQQWLSITPGVVHYTRDFLSGRKNPRNKKIETTLFRGISLGLACFISRSWV